MDSFQIVEADHLDLLVSAATAYGQLTNPTTAAFSPAHAAAFTTASPDEAGQLLLDENLAAARWRSHRGCGRLPARHLVTYRHRPVEDWEPVDVLKAVHAYSHATADFPGWAGSAAHRLTADVAHAATQRLPGYAEAPWWWRRPAQPAIPIGLHGAWCPDVAGVTWVGRSELLQRWPDAGVVVLTAEVPEQLPADLSPRTRTTYLLTQPGGLTAAQWTWAGALGQVVLVELPTAAAWLQQRLPPGGAELEDLENALVDYTRVQAGPAAF